MLIKWHQEKPCNIFFVRHARSHEDRFNSAQISGIESFLLRNVQTSQARMDWKANHFGSPFIHRTRAATCGGEAGMKLTIQINGKKHELTAAEARRIYEELRQFCGEPPAQPTPIVIIDRAPVYTPMPYPVLPFYYEGPTICDTICSSRS